MLRCRTVDVSALEPPQPMEVALAALRELAADEYLVLQHRREPVPLYAMLAAMGFCHRVRPGRATAVEVVIWRAGGEAPEAAP
jgi:hypothetical protein